MYAAISIPFDVRDIDKDDPSRKTLAQIFGKQGALIISGIAFCIALLLVLDWSSSSALLYFILAMVFYSLLLKNIFASNQNNMMLRFVDLAPILWVIFH
jgi:1,4-dihydroxy-2-naphthoate octaprenyltransferase